MVHKTKKRCIEQNTFVSNIKVPAGGLANSVMASKISLATQTKVVNFGATFTKQAP